MSKWNGPVTDLRTKFESALFATVAALIVLGPPVWAVWRVWNGASLLTLNTVTVTTEVVRPDGVAIVLGWWAGALFFIWFFAWAVSGGMPRP
jgi:hypothetical protein